MTAISIQPHFAAIDNRVESFDVTMTVGSRHNGGDLVLDTEHVSWLGRDLVRVQTPAGLLHLDAHEARDLAIALRELALYIDEQPRELHRSTAPGAPAAEDLMGAGL